MRPRGPGNEDALHRAVELNLPKRGGGGGGGWLGSIDKHEIVKTFVDVNDVIRNR